MDYLLMVLLGFVGGGICTFVGFERRRKTLRKMKHDIETQTAHVSDRLEDTRRKNVTLDEGIAKLEAWKDEFKKQVISHKELQDENRVLKRDLRNLAVNFRKLELDRRLQGESQAALDQKVQDVGSRYLSENVKWIGKSLTANNFVSCKQRLQDVIERCRGIGFQVTEQQESAYLADLRAEFERLVKIAFQREEQARIKAQIREEQQREREIQRELERLERERVVAQAALERALAQTHDLHSAEIERLKARLAEAEAAKERTISQAQLTKAGHVYVISNIGSFGEGVFKIGMTRRLEPFDRVRELGDASVPFPFDIHMMISCDDAPALESALHRHLLRRQVNKMNPRKEFFQADIDTIARIVREHHCDIEYVADAEALEFRQSLTMSDEDQEFVEHVFDELEQEDSSFGDGPSFDVATPSA